VRLLAVHIVGVFFITGCAGKFAPWRFWESRKNRGGRDFSFEIPAPPDAMMPTVPPRVRERPQANGVAADDQRRSPLPVAPAELQPVYFDFDSAALTDRASETVRRNAEWLLENGNVEIQVQGHCDERGTIEYNFNLGQRRADAVKRFLMSMGIPENRIDTISYGEERPAVQGSGEQVWRLNRRVEFRVY
jgi:peptidoglycan-associated lipoprotein